jgi:hypothetical protein
MLNIAPEALLEVAKEQPELALKHPAKELFQLENPSLWARIEYTALLVQAEQTLQATAAKVSPRVLGYWRFDCVCTGPGKVDTRHLLSDSSGSLHEPTQL